MICQATYDSLEAIPESLRDEFASVNGKWQLKDTAIPGVGPLFNAALYANEQRAVTQKKAKDEELRKAKEELTVAQDKLSVLDSPGNKVLSREDATLFEDYIKMGTPKEVQTKLAGYNDLSQKVGRYEAAETLGKIAAAGININPEVLADWATSADAQGLSFFVKSVEQTDAKGVKTMVDVPFVKIQEKDGETIKVSEKELLPFAKEKLPEWKYTALTTVPDSKAPVKGTAPVNQQQQPNGVRLPDFGNTAREPANEVRKSPVEEFNKQRDARPNPFAKQLSVPVTNGSGIGKFPS